MLKFSVFLTNDLGMDELKNCNSAMKQANTLEFEL